MDSVIKDNFNIIAFEALPEHLPLSSNIDFLLLLIGLKPSLRIGPISLVKCKEVCDWGDAFGFYTKIDNEGYVFLSIIQNVDLLMSIDQSLENHCVKFGLLLGYPECCSKSIGNIGEEHIDEYEKNIVFNWSFEGKYHLINPKNHFEGGALISHIPCSPTCEYSYKIAKSCFRIIKSHRGSPSFKKWAYLFQ